MSLNKYAATTAYAAANDDFTTAAFHYRFAQHIRTQVEEEYKIALDEEVAAKRVLDVKLELLQCKGGATCAASLGVLMHTTTAACCSARRRC